ncbi:hypothetical protein BK662_24255 [Pseudomonas frederiksbergensis]|uniref:Uncharacterized protein n=1 Tax=Pseudomonas frederiksbergensis TaxID=104087 RepID=A0A423HM50_9PSED|nr:hypothetical protein BK662_18440 [Pseudomonas frederiksbergensis]RON14233.1 hypothetical protein BK662_24255 [Pseudomonas frederiksbergensis]
MISGDCPLSGVTVSAEAQRQNAETIVARQGEMDLFIKPPLLSVCFGSLSLAQRLATNPGTMFLGCKLSFRLYFYFLELERVRQVLSTDLHCDTPNANK